MLCYLNSRRNLDYFLTCLQNAVNTVDPEIGGGELIIRIPKEVLACTNGETVLCVHAHALLRDCQIQNYQILQNYALAKIIIIIMMECSIAFD